MFILKGNNIERFVFWLLTLSFALAPVVTLEILVYLYSLQKGERRDTILRCITSSDAPLYIANRNDFAVIYVTTVGFFLPMTFMVFAYTSIALVLSKSIQQNKDLRGGNR